MNNLESEKSPQLSIGQACNEILGIMQVNFQTGRYDEERSVFMGFIAKIESGELTPEEGLQQARAYANGRQEGFGG